MTQMGTQTDARTVSAGLECHDLKVTLVGASGPVDILAGGAKNVEGNALRRLLADAGKSLHFLYEIGERRGEIGH